MSKRRDKKAALTLFKGRFSGTGRAEELVTDGRESYRSALKEIGAEERQVT